MRVPYYCGILQHEADASYIRHKDYEKEVNVRLCNISQAEHTIPPYCALQNCCEFLGPTLELLAVLYQTEIALERHI